MFGLGNNEPPAGTTPQEVVEAPQVVPPSSETQETTSSAIGLVREWEQAYESLKAVQKRIGERGAEIHSRRLDAIKRLNKLHLPSGENGVKKGVLVGKGGRELNVTMTPERDYHEDYISFDDLADPVRREVQIDQGSVSLASKEDDVCIDRIDGLVSGNGGGRDGFAFSSRREIANNNKYAHLRGDLGRDVLDAATDGLGFILDPKTTLKPATPPTPAPAPQPMPTA